MASLSFLKKRSLWYWIYALNWAVILWFWSGPAAELLKAGWDGVAVALGRLAGLSAAYLVLVQFFLMGRMPWLERMFGLDRLSQYHHSSGKRGIWLLVLHPIFIVFGYASINNASPFPFFTGMITQSDDVFLALIALILFVVVVLSSIYISKLKLRYESWYLVHLSVYLAIFMSLSHQIEIGTSLTASKIFHAYWIALYAVVLVSHLLFRFIRPVYFFFKYHFVVDQIVRESPSAVSVYISGKNLDRFNIHAGQFMILRFFTKKMWWQAHPFSMSMAPDGRRLRVTVKELGDFTKMVKDVGSGTRVMIDGPYGVFTDLFSVSSKVLFIAGGIGITPVRSLMEEMLKKGKDVVLLYANRLQSDVVFMNELRELENKYHARIILVMSDEANYAGEKGRVDEEKLKRLVPDLKEREVYLCGPVPMMDSLLAVFPNLGIAKNAVHYEKFSLG